MSRLDVVDYLSHGSSADSDDIEFVESENIEEENAKENKDFLNLYCTNLNKKASQIKN